MSMSTGKYGARRRKLLLAGLVALVSVGAFAMRFPPRRLAQEVHRIKPGMSRAEVEAVIGPPGDFTTGPTLPVAIIVDPDHYPGSSTLAWENDEEVLYVVFDASGGVAYDQWFPNFKADQGVLANLRWRAERQWRRWFP